MDLRTPDPRIAYFSMEIAFDPAVPTYSGGLGILAGDTLRAAADLGVPMAGVSLLYRNGYFRQHIDPQGNQMDEPYPWTPEQLLERLPVTGAVQIEGHAVRFRVWRYVVRGVNGHTIPIYLLDTGLSENDPRDCALTDTLYGGDQRYRLAQEALLGIGGVALLRALGHEQVETYHMNEGHAALLTLALLRERLGGRPLTAAGEDDEAAVRDRCVFTVHTPVAVDPVQLGTSVSTLYTAGAVKPVPGVRTFVSVDGGMYENPRPALYGARYEAAVATRANAAPTQRMTVAGRCCESGDVLIWDADLPEVREGDLLAVFATGAYTYSMASNYNRYTRPALICVRDGIAQVAVERETLADLVRHDRAVVRPPAGAPLPR